MSIHISNHANIHINFHMSILQCHDNCLVIWHVIFTSFHIYMSHMDSARGASFLAKVQGFVIQVQSYFPHPLYHLVFNVLRATPRVLSMWPCKLKIMGQRKTCWFGRAKSFVHSLLSLVKGTAERNSVGDWLDSLLGSCALVLVLSRLLAAPVLVWSWKKVNNRTWMWEIFLQVTHRAWLQMPLAYKNDLNEGEHVEDIHIIF
jgi:hypothetical protein